MFDLAIVDMMENERKALNDLMNTSEDVIVMAASTRLRLVDPNELVRKRGGWNRTNVAQALDLLRQDMPAISDAIHATYLAPTAISRSRGG